MRSMQRTRVHLMMAARSTPMPVIHRLQQEVLPQSLRVVCLLQCRSTLTERPMQACTWYRYVSAIGITSHCTACIQCVCHASVCARGVHEVCLYQHCGQHATRKHITFSTSLHRCEYIQLIAEPHCTVLGATVLYSVPLKLGCAHIGAITIRVQALNAH
jgi:hypothetical protein